MKYLVKIKPLEPYTFGGENGFSYEEIEYNGSYYMNSKNLPEQTTLIGTMRYLLLQSEGALKSNFQYSPEEKERMEKICGKDSFQFEQENQEFGYIKELSPMFLIDHEEDIYIQNPYCNKISEKTGFSPIQLKEAVESSMGTINFPVSGESGYEGKQGFARGYICITNEKKEIKQDIFSTQTFSGNNLGLEEDGYFKREAISMKDMAMGLYITLDEQAKELPKKTIVFMGKKGCAFQIVSKKVEDAITLDKQAESFFEKFNTKEPWYYCLSDVFIKEDVTYKNFAIVETKKMRNLATIYINAKFMKKRQRQYQLLQAGSSFYKEAPELKESYLTRMGYNHIIKIGG